MKVPFGRSYWVVEGSLLAGFYPGERHRPQTPDNLNGLLDVGIRCVIDLMEAHETNWSGVPFVPYRDLLQDLAADRGVSVTYLNHSIRDFDVPAEEQMISILNDIDASITAENPVYVHCRGGIGRTGTVVGCFLMRHGLCNQSNVMQRIAVLRASETSFYVRSPEAPDQRRMVCGWSRGR